MKLVGSAVDALGINDFKAMVSRIRDNQMGFFVDSQLRRTPLSDGDDLLVNHVKSNVFTTRPKSIGQLK